ncbi:MAG: hypothetical protein ACLQL2_04970 [Methylovirgula sp.]
MHDARARDVDLTPFGFEIRVVENGEEADVVNDDVDGLSSTAS